MTKKIYVDVFVFLLLHIYRRHLSPPIRKMYPVLDVPLMGENIIFTCVAKGESRSRSQVTPSVCPSVRPTVPKSCHRNSSKTPIIMKLGM